MEQYLDSVLKESTTSKSVPAIGAIVCDAAGKTLYKGTFGNTKLDDDQALAFKPDTQIAMQSCAKIIACIAAFQLLEQGKLNLNDPVEKYYSRAADLEVLEGFNDGDGGDGAPRTRKPKTKPTILHLLTHTTGLSYDFWEPDTHRWCTKGGQWTGWQGKLRDALFFPVLFEPGTKYLYGVNIDWLGFVIEEITGMPFKDYVREHISKPLGLKYTGGYPDPTHDVMMAHARLPDGSFMPLPAFIPMDENQELGAGGVNFFSTLEEYAQILLVVLNNGTHPVSKVQLLKPETVQKYMFEDALPWLQPQPNLTRLEDIKPSAQPGLSIEGHMLPESVTKGWSCGSLMLNTSEDVTLQVPTARGSKEIKKLPGRKKGSAGWAGLANHYYFIDRTAGRVGLITASLAPFMDTEVFRLFNELEGAVYTDIEKQGS